MIGIEFNGIFCLETDVMVYFELDNVLWEVWSVEGAWKVKSSVVKRLQNYLQLKELFFSTEHTQRLITVLKMRWKPLLLSVMGWLGCCSAERTQDLLLLPWAFLLGCFWLSPGWSSCRYLCLVLWVMLQEVTTNIYKTVENSFMMV